jgi:hypothetical protein
MNTTVDARAGLTMAQGTVQTVLLIVVSLVGAWIGIYKIPWQVSRDPCLLAAAITVVWYAIACLAVDLALGAYVVARVPVYQRASRIATEN